MRERGKIMKKTYTVSDFKANTYAYKPIEETGYISAYSGHYDINYSSILTRLIQEAGRFCESFASDLFIDWRNVDGILDESGEIEKTFLFGFRQNGVDHDNFILSRYNGGAYLNPQGEYRSMWRLDIVADGLEIKMTLGRVF